MSRPELAFEIAGRILAVAGLLATAYFWFDYSGPFRWFSELQITLWDSYRPLLAGVLTLVFLTLVPVSVLYIALLRLRVIEAFDRTKLDQAATPHRTPSALPYLIALALFLGFSGAGAHQLWRGRGSDELRSYRVGNLAGLEPEGGHVTLTGELASESALSYQEEGRRRVWHTYVPMVPAGWTRAEPVRFFVEYRTYEGAAELAPLASGEVDVTGTLDAAGLPGFLRERAGVPLAPRHYLLIPGEKPSHRRALGAGLMSAGFVLGGLLAGLTAFRRRDKEYRAA